MKVTYVRSEPIARNITSFLFQPEQPVRYIAGQFIELHVPHDNKDKRGDKRWFTLSSAPSDELLSITTNFAKEYGSSFKAALQALRPGAELKMASPMGDFVLPKDASVPLIFIAGGIGCTPFHSIIRELQLTSEKRDITLLYAARSLEDVAFRDIFGMLEDKFKIILTEPAPGWKGLSGRLSAEVISDMYQISPEHYIYISGPEPMVEMLAKDLKNSGISKRHIHGDYFPGYPLI
jgi:glycine betaine catabolism B